MNFFKFLKSIVIRSDDLTPKSIEIIPNGSTNTTTTITSSQTSDRVVSMPDGSGVVVLEGLAQELTDKEIDGHLNTISNLEVSDFNPTAIVTDLSGTPTNNQLLTAAGVKSELAALTDQDITSVYTPTNYIPVPVGAEDPDMVSAHLKGINSALVDQYRSQLDFEYIFSNGAVEISKHTSAVIPGLGITENKTLTFKNTSEYYINETFQVVNVTSYDVLLRTSDSNLITTILPGWGAAIKILNGSNISSGISSSFSIYQFPIDTTFNATKFNMRGKVVNNVADPVIGSDAANKTYVDSMVSPFLPLPSQAGNDGKFLGTDGINLSWKDVTPASALITIDNNQTTPKAISTFNVDSSIYRSFNAEYWIKRTTDGVLGGIDTAFKSNLSNIPTGFNRLSEQPDGKILFNNAIDYGGVTGRSRLIRLNSDGTVDVPFCVNATDGAKFGSATISTMTTQPDGKILVGGTLMNYSSILGLDSLIRLNPDGTLDTTFTNNASSDSKFSGNVGTTAVQPDGKILVGGSFSDYNGVTDRNALIRLNPDGTIDSAFCNNASDGAKFSDGIYFVYITSVKVQQDGKILVAGSFTNYGGVGGRNRLIRLNPDGTIDTTFCTNASDGAKFNYQINSISLQQDGKILVGGYFTNYGGVAGRSRLVRFNIDGSLDTAYCIDVVDNKFDGAITNLIESIDNKVFIVGNFSGTSPDNIQVFLSEEDEKLSETGTIRGLYIDETNLWFIDNTALKSANVVLDMNTNDELTYTSSNMTASNYDGKMRFKIMNKLEK